MQHRRLHAFIERIWSERARGAREFGLIQHPSSSFGFLRWCPFVSVLVDLHSCLCRSLATVVLRGEAGRKDLDGTTQMDTDGQKRPGPFYQEHHSPLGIDVPRPLRGCCTDRLRSPFDSYFDFGACIEAPDQNGNGRSGWHRQIEYGSNELNGVNGEDKATRGMLEAAHP